MTLIEDLACRVPVLAALSEACGARALLEKLPSICSAQERAPDLLAKAALELFADPISIQNIEKAGRGNVVVNYSSMDFVKRINALYVRLLKRR